LTPTAQVRAGWLRRILAAWALQAGATRERLAAELMRREMELGARRVRRLLGRCVRGWVELVEEGRIERAAAEYRVEMLSKVTGWLQEMDTPLS